MINVDVAGMNNSQDRTSTSVEKPSKNVHNESADKIRKANKKYSAVKLELQNDSESSPMRRSQGPNSNLSHYTNPPKLMRGKYSPMMTRKQSSQESPFKLSELYKTYVNHNRRGRKEDYFGKQSMNSRTSNEPSFSFGLSKKNPNQIFNKNDMNEVRGKDSPGVGKYSLHNYSLSNSVMRNRGFAKVSENRFEEQRLRIKKNKDTAHTLMPAQFPPIDVFRKRIGRKSISQNRNYCNLVYNGFTQGKQCNFNKALRFQIKDINANPLFILNNEAPGPDNFEMLWSKYKMKNTKKKVNVQDILKKLTATK
ncbi:unnamed protein product [Moneuplotes crassus]|uniref:Uncharacterized protein n=1 Tax=Euplotes crassus TaxID=5936 RepID=A0AAD1UHN2_EUPCR|nr:unnamed protein product [Moneuplotes crassus]